MFRRTISLIIVITFVCSLVVPVPKVQAQSLLGLPEPGAMVSLSPAYEPALIKGLTVHKDNPFLFDFIVDTGHSKLAGDALKKEGDRLIKYFFAALTIPDRDLWVNLSPYEKDRMVPQALGQTAMGRDLLAQDYMLKQLTASLIYPEKELGKSFWDKVYAQAREQFGTTNVPVNTFNKVWIVAQKASVYEHNQTAFIVSGHLKVMLEKDYLALQKHTPPPNLPHEGGGINSNLPHEGGGINSNLPHEGGGINSLGSQIIRSIILPAIEHEVNTGKNFAILRQIFYSQILATWFKRNLKQALLSQVYADKSTVNGINLQDPSIKEKIYQRYLQAYKKGVFNYIKEDADKYTNEAIPRKYFSGGFAVDPAELTLATRGEAQLAAADMFQAVDIQAVLSTGPDAAMRITSPKPLISAIAAPLISVIILLRDMTGIGSTILKNGKRVHFAEAREIFQHIVRMVGSMDNKMKKKLWELSLYYKVEEDFPAQKDEKQRKSLEAFLKDDRILFDPETEQVRYIARQVIENSFDFRSSAGAPVNGKLIDPVAGASDIPYTQSHLWLPKEHPEEPITIYPTLEMVEIRGANPFRFTEVIELLRNMTSSDAVDRMLIYREGRYNRAYLLDALARVVPAQWELQRDEEHGYWTINKEYKHGFMSWTDAFMVNIVTGSAQVPEFPGDRAMTNSPIADTRALFEAKLNTLVDEIYQKFLGNVKSDKTDQFKYLLKWFLEGYFFERDFKSKIVETLNQPAEADAIINEAEKRRSELSTVQKDAAKSNRNSVRTGRIDSGRIQTGDLVTASPNSGFKGKISQSISGTFIGRYPEAMTTILSKGNRTVTVPLTSWTITKHDAAADRASVTPGGIDLNTLNNGLTVSKDSNGGVTITVDPAMIERIRHEGIESATPVIINMRFLPSVGQLLDL